MTKDSSVTWSEHWWTNCIARWPSQILRKMASKRRPTVSKKGQPNISRRQLRILLKYEFFLKSLTTIQLNKGGGGCEHGFEQAHNHNN